jgi:predicted nucleic acid-binding protein
VAADVPEHVLIDTSAWVAFFRGTTPGRAEVQTLVADDQAVRCGPVELELRRGLRRHEIATVLRVWTALAELAVEAIDFTSAGDLLRDLAENGTSVPSIDGLITTIALRYDVPLLTLDRRPPLALAAGALHHRRTVGRQRLRRRPAVMEARRRCLRVRRSTTAGRGHG